MGRRRARPAAGRRDGQRLRVTVLHPGHGPGLRAATRRQAVDVVDSTADRRNRARQRLRHEPGQRCDRLEPDPRHALVVDSAGLRRPHPGHRGDVNAGLRPELQHRVRDGQGRGGRPQQHRSGMVPARPGCQHRQGARRLAGPDRWASRQRPEPDLQRRDCRPAPGPPAARRGRLRRLRELLRHRSVRRLRGRCQHRDREADRDVLDRGRHQQR